MICGIDEAGRGPLAGPVCSASVILTKDFPVHILNDSKKMTAAKREEVRQVIYKEAYVWGLGWADHREIDELNILQATLLAMKRAFLQMLEKASLLSPQNFRENFIKNLNVIIDGTFAPDIGIPCTTMVKADSKISEVMAASILAKYERDKYMDEMAKQYPLYGYEKHKGYPTKAHREAVQKYGTSPIQRLTFKVR